MHVVCGDADVHRNAGLLRVLRVFPAPPRYPLPKSLYELRDFFYSLHRDCLAIYYTLLALLEFQRIDDLHNLA